MLFGVSTACMYPKNLEEILEQYGEQGICDIEIFINTTYELSQAYAKEMLKRVAHYGMTVHALHPFTSGMEPLMLFSDYERRVDDFLDFHKLYFELMQKLGAKIFVFHGDHKFSQNDVGFYAERFLRLKDAAHPYGVTVAQENISRCKSASLEFINELSALLGDDLSFVFDIKQALRSGCDPMEVVKTMGKQVVHVHANDHTAAQDCLLPGQGNFDFYALYQYFKTLNIAPTTVIEVYRNNFSDEGELLNSLNFIKETC